MSREQSIQTVRSVYEMFNHKAIKLQFAEVFTMRDDKIRQMKAYWDSATLMRQLGLR